MHRKCQLVHLYKCLQLVKAQYCFKKINTINGDSPTPNADGGLGGLGAGLPHPNLLKMHQAPLPIPPDLAFPTLKKKTVLGVESEAHPSQQGPKRPGNDDTALGGQAAPGPGSSTRASPNSSTSFLVSLPPCAHFLTHLPCPCEA